MICGMDSRPCALASNARTDAGTALDTKSAALAMSTMMVLPASNMLSRSDGPSAFTVSRSGFSATMIFTLVGWQ